MKKKLILMCVAAILAGTTIIGGTLAGFNTGTNDTGIVEISTKSLGIDVIQTGEATTTLEEIDSTKVVPGGKLPFVRSVVNNVEDGYELYVRVTIYKKWMDETLNHEAARLYMKDEIELTEENAAQIEKLGWILQYQDEEQVILYYKYPLSPNETTANVLEEIGMDASLDNAYADQNLGLEIEVDAVQSIAGTDAMISEWGVYPTMDSSGTIISIAE